jgi:predicted alpha/beta-hydrolase family hydrolase
MNAAHPGALAIGSRLESYEIRDVLGVGGFGITYKGYDHSLHCDVAIKEYLPHGLALRTPDGTTVVPKSKNDEKYYEYGLKRFLDEARILAKFKERAIVRVSRFLEANGTAYLVMDYEDGESLAEYLNRSGVLNEGEIRAVLVPILEGLRAVHDKDVLHRDIKPGNIFLRRDGPPVLLDFGAARQALGEQTRTMTGIVTPGYAPFEQYGALGRQGPWTDLYALGATLYHCATGRAPVEAPDRIAALQEGAPDPMKPAREAGAGRCAPELLAVIDWMLAPNARDRPQSADEALARLGALPEAKSAGRPGESAFPRTQLLGARAPGAPAPVPAPPTRDQIAAFDACRAQAGGGEASAQYQLGMMYAHGRGTAADPVAALEWLKKAAGQGHVGAQCKLGLMYARGVGTTKDEHAAAEWLRKAAEQNDISAQFNLGMMYAHGLGVSQDSSQARHWYRLAAERGHAGARTNLEVLEARPARLRRWLMGAAILLAVVIAWVILRRLTR